MENKIVVMDEFSLKFHEEDHTMMNPLRWAISNNWTGDSVEFSGYTIPHPSEKCSVLNIQFENQSLQTSKNVLKKVYEGLECIEIIASKLLDCVSQFDS